MHIFVYLILDSCIKFHALKIWQRQNSLLDLIWCILSAASFLMHHLWCLSSGVSPRAHPLQLIVTFFFLWELECIHILAGQVDVMLHWLHLFDFSPLCVIKCILKLPACVDAKSHWLHLFDFSPLSF